MESSSPYLQISCFEMAKVKGTRICCISALVIIVAILLYKCHLQWTATRRSDNDEGRGWQICLTPVSAELNSWLRTVPKSPLAFMLSWFESESLWTRQFWSRESRLVVLPSHWAPKSDTHTSLHDWFLYGFDEQWLGHSIRVDRRTYTEKDSSRVYFNHKKNGQLITL